MWPKPRESHSCTTCSPKTFLSGAVFCAAQYLAIPDACVESQAQAAEAVQLCDQIIAERTDLNVLNQQSLAWRGKGRTAGGSSNMTLLLAPASTKSAASPFSFARVTYLAEASKGLSAARYIKQLHSTNAALPSKRGRALCRF